GPVELTDREPIALQTLHHARRDDGTGGIHHATDDTACLDIGLDDAARVAALQPVVPVRAVQVLKVPPGQPVLRRHDHGVVVEQRPHLRRQRLDLIGLDRQEHDILRPCLGTGSDRAQSLGHFLGGIRMYQRQSLGADRRKLRALLDRRHLLTRSRKTYRENAADRSGTYDSDFHYVTDSYSNRLVSVPMPSITMLTVLPGFIDPTPPDVPQAMPSPASSVMSCEIRLTSFAGGKIMSDTG